jgi:membrane protease YdiL (CAAX protease family)
MIEKGNQLLLQILAQAPAPGPAANPANADNLSAGQMLAGLMVLLAMSGSLITLSIWLVRYMQSGNALPVADRGVLRIPPILTRITIGVSAFFVLMVALSSSDPEPAPVPAPAPVPGAMPVPATGQTGNAASPGAANDGQDDASATPMERLPTVEERIREASGESNDAVAKAIEKEEAVERMKDGVVNTLLLDLLLLGALGIVIWVVGKQGRVRLEDPGALAAAEESALMATPMRWNDLDTSAPFSTPGQPFSLSTRTDPWSEPSSTSPGLAAATQNVLPDEPFSLMTELRFAAEVFLAAYLPTTLLRILIIKLIENMTGEMPDQHPFLEILDEGVGPGLMFLIFLIAVVFAPIVEELQFRVVILGGIAQRGRWVLALVVSSLLFAFAHGYPDCFALIPLAVILGYCYLRRRSYITVMIVHFLFNMFNMALAFLAMM